MVLGTLGWLVTLWEGVLDSDCYMRYLKEDSPGQAPLGTGAKEGMSSEPPSHPVSQA